MKTGTAIAGAIGVLLAAVVVAPLVLGADHQVAPCHTGRLTFVTNGRIHTMDSTRTVVSRALIANGKFVTVGDAAAATTDGCTDTIDLGGRTALPGLIDNHFHVQLVGQRPGNETREIENTSTIAEVQQVIRTRAQGVAAGGFITAVGGLHPRQWKENRLPTLAELDAAAPGHPVYIHVRFTGPGVTNSLGKAFFESKGVPVGADGAIGENEPAGNALNALRSIRSLEDKKKGMREVFSYFNHVGLTTVHSVLGSGLEGGAQYFTTQDHAPMLELLRDDQLTLRLRLYWNAGRRPDGRGNPVLKDILDAQMPFFGNDMVFTAGIGEHVLIGALENAVPLSDEYDQTVRLLAQRRWQLMEHSFNEANHAARADVWERVDKEFPIKDLRWSIDHVNTIELPTIERMKRLGVAVRAHGARYLFPGGTSNGPPYRKLIDSGIRVGAGLDGAQAAPINPWLEIYYMVTGKDTTGAPINKGQEISRWEAVWLRTAANGWFSREEDKLGVVVPGAFGDLVVLNADFFDEKAVPDEAIKKMRSVLTVVGGRIVFGDPRALR